MNSSELQQAMAMDCNLFIEASAGTGKTYTLTKRYCAILDDFARQALENPQAAPKDASNILVITFTRKAANEMTVKIYRDLKRLLAGELIDASLPNVGKYLRQCSPDYRMRMEESFSRHAISTIDSFCTQVLKDYAFDAKLDPDFKVEEEVRSDLFFEKQLDRFLLQKASDNDPDLSAVFNVITATHVKKIIKYFYCHRLFLQNWLDKMSEKRQTMSENDLKVEIWNQWLEKYTPEFDEQKVCSEIKRWFTYLEKSSIDDFDQGKNLLEDLQKALESIPKDVTGNCLRQEICDKIFPLLMTQQNEFMKNFKGAKKNWGNPAALAELKESYQQFINTLGITAFQVMGAPNKMDKYSLEILLNLHALFMDFQVQMDSFQQQMGYLSFDDVILKTRSLLVHHKEVRKKLSHQYAHIMVDEFQDTNDPRWDIIRMIASDEKGNVRPSGLFIVGDKKQSIYGFQQADVTVMNRAKKDLSQTSIPLKEISLEYNFRASEQVIDQVINKIFPRLFVNTETPWQAKFSPTKTGKPGFLSAEKHPIFTMLVRTISDVPIEKRELASAVNAAKTTQEMLQWWDNYALENEISHSGPVVGILLRSFTHVGFYASMFKRYNIPLEIIAGNSFFQRQEIYDICYLLAFFANPHDNIALTALGRSPWLMLTDQEVDLFRERKEKESVWSFIQRHEAFKEVAQTLKAWLKKSQHIFLPDVLEDLLADQERELAYLSEIEGERCLANVDLAIHLLRGLMTGGMSLRECLAWFNTQRDQESRREEAAPEGESRVCLMTIHKAKGLEFPMVIIGDMNRSPRNSSVIVAHAVGEETIDVTINLKEDDTDTSIQPGVLYAICQEQKEQEEAEELRIFYVAVTRAMFQVAFLAEFTQSNRSPSKNTPWYKYVVKGVLKDHPPDPTSVDWKNFEDSSEGLSVLNNSWESLWDTLPQAKKEVKSWDLPQAKEKTWKPLYVLTPHDVMAHIDGEKSLESSKEHFSEENRQYGIFFHKVMEERWWNSASAANAWLKKNATTFTHLSLAKTMKRLEEDLERVKRDPLFEKIENIPLHDAFYELPVSAWYESDKERFELRGVVDLLYRQGDTWTLLDYKTDQNFSSLNQYKVQMNLYQEMIYQSFSIEAQGIIWFVGLGKTLQIPRDPSVLQYLTSDHKSLSAFLEKGKINPILMEEIVAFLEDYPTLILCVTKGEAEEIQKNLVWRKKARPWISILSWQDLQRIRNVPGRGLNPAVQALLCYHVVKESGTVLPKPGIARKLSEAVTQIELYNLTADPQEDALIQKVLHEIRARDLTTDGDILRWLKENHPFKNMDIFLTGWYQPSPLRHDLLTAIAIHARRFAMPESKAIPDVNAWKKNETIANHNHKVLVCHRSEDEVRTVFREIASQKITNLQSLHIAVSNPSEYEPLICRIAKEYDFPVSFSTRIPLKETPAGRWLLNLITLIEKRQNPEWGIIADVFLDPTIPTNDALYALDIQIRQKALETLEEIQKFFKKKDSDFFKIFQSFVEPKLQEIASLKTFSDIQKYLKKSLKIFQDAANLLDNQQTFNQRVLQTLNDIIEMAIPSLKLIGIEKGAMVEEGLFLLREWINQEELSRFESLHGIPVTGFLDTINLEPACLWLLGLNQTDFPVRIYRNPFLREAPYNPWFLNRRMISHWSRLTHVRFMASKMFSGGTDTEPSALLEAFEQISPPAIKDFHPGQRDFYRTFTDAFIEFPPKNRAIQRHNVLVTRKITENPYGEVSPYHGKTRPIPFPHKSSATAIESLIRCPMQYWLGKILNLKVTDASKTQLETMTVGNILHEILCRFGTEKGFTLPMEQAMTLMKSLVYETLKKNGSDPENDLWEKQRFRFVINGLDENPPKGKMTDLVKKNLEILQSLSEPEMYFELKFEDKEAPDKAPHDDLIWHMLESDVFPKLLLNGKIDKLFIDHEQKRILISDYKTGKSYTLKDISDGLNIQPIVYYLKVKQEFPAYRTVFVYESIPKDHSPYKMSQEMGDTGEQGLFVTSKSPLKIILEPLDDENAFTLQKIISWFQDAINHLKEGTFPHVVPERYDKVCHYCELKYMCRKPALM